MNQDGIATAGAMTMIQPSSTPSMPAAATGPGCGGMNACSTDSPASSGIA